MTRQTLRFALGLLAAGAMCSVLLLDEVHAQGAGGANAGGFRIVRAQKAKGELKIGRAYAVITKDGKVHSGSLIKANATSITLKSKRGGATTVPRKNIEEIREVPANAATAASPPIDLKIGERYFVEETTGRVLIGTLAKMDAKSITLKDAGGRAFVIKRSNIDTIRKIPKATADAKKRLEELRKQQEKLRKELEARRLAILRQRGRTQPATQDRHDADPKDPKETLVLLSPKGPMVAEFSIFVDGKPFRMMRENIVDEMLAVTKTKDGKVDELKWEAALKNPRFSFGRNAYVGGRFAASRTALIRRYDLNGDGIVQREEARAYLSQLGSGGAFNVRPSYNAQRQPDVKSVLDTNKDGVISADELKIANERLKSRDRDDNDLLTADELGGGQQQYGYQFAGGSRGMRLPTQSRSVFLLGPTASLTGLYTELVKHYGDDKKVVRKDKFQLDPKLFATLDLNKNGILESGEVVGFHLAEPAATFEIRIGQGPHVVAKSLAKELKGNSSDKSPSEILSIALPGWKLRIKATAGVVQTYNYSRTAESYLTRYDTDKNGYLEEKELKSQGAAGQYAVQQFKVWDANGDGKVYADEIKKALDRTLAPRTSQVTLSERSQGPSLFAALDETGDGRLSLREMRNAGTRLLALDRNQNRRIDPDEMPSEVELTFDRGYGTTTYQFYQGGRARPAAAPIRGPRWFYHMDKNGDGDVSLREFLGTKEQFHKLDTNRDGLIELKEAEAAGMGK